MMAKKKFFKKKLAGTAKDKQQDKKINMIVKKLSPERKYVESRIAVTNFVAAGAIRGPFSSLAVGNTNGTRVGNKVQDVSLESRMLLLNPVNAQAATRVIWFKWFDDSVPTVGEIINAPGGTSDFLSPLDLDAKRARKYQILSDSHYVMGRDYVAAATLASDNSIHIVRKFNKLSGMTAYDGDTAADIIKGATYCLLLGSPGATYEMTTQYVYTDA